MSLIARVRRSIEQRQLLAPGARVLVACSGGPDSAALLGVLSSLGRELELQLEAASVDHGLRQSAAADVAIAGAQAAALGIAFHALRVEVAAGPSLQAQARDARYAALLALAGQRGLDKIATGHTLEDQAETVLLRLLRGAGIRGLGAIEPLRDDGVVRPLIDCPRAEAHAFARDRFREIADDASNRDPRFERVRVREALLPTLREQHPGLDAHLAHLADEARLSTAFLDEAAHSALLSAQITAESLKISAIRSAPEALRSAIFRRWLHAPVGVLGAAHLRQLAELCAQGRGEVWLSAEHRVLAHPDGTLRLQRREVSA